MIVNVYAPIIDAPNFIKQTLLDIKGQIGPKTIKVYDFNTSFSSIDITDQKKSTQNIRVKLHFPDINKIFHETDAEYTFFSTTHETFSKIDHILVHKASLNKCKKTEIVSCIIFELNGIKLDKKEQEKL
jgi:exonuclease III